MTTAVDTNVLLALLYDDEHAAASEQALRTAYQNGKVVTTPLVYAELAADGHFGTASALDQFLTDLSIQLVQSSRQALYRAGEQFQTYTDRRPEGLQCPECGAKRTVECPSCENEMSPRQHIAADFVIGGHAAVDADELLSFDTGFYETYFPSVDVRPD